MSQPKVSIIVPVYNVEKYLERCVNSLKNQTLKDIEIILVDDSSTDNSPQICDKMAEKDPRIKVIHKANEGAGMARNAALGIANDMKSVRVCICHPHPRQLKCYCKTEFQKRC